MAREGFQHDFLELRPLRQADLGGYVAQRLFVLEVDQMEEAGTGGRLIGQFRDDPGGRVHFGGKFPPAASFTAAASASALCGSFQTELGRNSSSARRARACRFDGGDIDDPVVTVEVGQRGLSDASATLSIAKYFPVITKPPPIGRDELANYRDLLVANAS